MITNPFPGKLNRTFARRIGKRLSDYNKDLLAHTLPKFQYSNERLQISPKQKKFLEIGFGMGEHLFNQISNNPDNLYIGAEVYLNGVANFLKLYLSSRGSSCEPMDPENGNDKSLDQQQRRCPPQDDECSILIWPNDLDMMLGDMPERSLDGIYILFPDPWHKRRYMKKRLVGKERLDIFKSKLKNGGFIAFASDIDDYFEDVKKLFMEDEGLNVQNTDFLIPHEHYLVTKYHKKAIKENRVAKFIQAIMMCDSHEGWNPL